MNRDRDEKGQFISGSSPLPSEAEAPAATLAPEPPEATPAELEEALVIVRRNRQIEQARYEEPEPEAGYPKTLYNPRYKFENVAMPRRDEHGDLVRDKQGLVLISAHYRRFSAGAMLVYSESDEAWIKQACAGRIFGQDTDEIVTCPTCGWGAFSHAAINVCMQTH